MNLGSIVRRECADTPGEGAPSRYGLAYARVSTDDQQRAGLSIPAQIRAIQGHAEAQGITVLEVYQEAESAFSDESRRPEFWRMVARAKADPRVGVILVHDFSLFFRDPYAGPQVKGELLASGVRVKSVTEPEFDPRTIAGLALEKMTEFKNASYSIDVAFHTVKGMRENVGRRDAELGYCYKNGGAAPWGFRAYKVERGMDRKGAPIMKTLWGKDETIVAGRPVWEWAREVLVGLRLERRASLDKVRDFLNGNGIPSPRKRGFWSVSTVHTMLCQQAALLQYAGYGVWNVHSKHGRHNPPSEWEIVENAHPAIITMEEAEAIFALGEEMHRRSLTRTPERMANVRAAGSPYLLSGGLFICKRCGSNMTSYRNRGHLYYACGSKVYRRGLGCGKGFTLRKDVVEDAVVEEVTLLLRSWADTKHAIELANRELRALHQQQSSESVELGRQLAEVDKEMDNIRAAVKAGLDDMEWVNGELTRLKTLREGLLAKQAAMGDEPRVPEIDVARVEQLRRQFVAVFERGTNEQKRAAARVFVRKVEVDPDTSEVFIYVLSRPPVLVPDAAGKPKNNAPGSVEPGARIGMVAGVRSAPEKKTWWEALCLAKPFCRLPKRGRGRRRGLRGRLPEGWVVVGEGQVAGS